jgi:beta-galactosidase/beta-glucuronidase
MDKSHSNYGFSNSREETATMEEVTTALPRAVFRPNTYILLDGEWKFQLDLEDRGLVESWYLKHDFTEVAEWPGTVEVHMAEARLGKGEVLNPEKIIAWYEREFPPPEAPELDTNSMLQLTFGACGYETQVWFNGILMRTIEGEETHFGEYTSFSYEINKEMLKPVNRITVRIADNLDADIPRGKQESHVYKRGGIWYQTYAGAVRSIWLETVERNRLRSRVGVISVVEEELISFNLTARIHDPGSYTIKVKIFKSKKETDHVLSGSDFPLKLEEGQKQQRVVLHLPGAKLWTPEKPNLYWLVAELVDEAGHKSRIESHFGLRKIEARGSFVYLNNKPVYLDGILYQPGNASYEEMKLHMHAMKELGCNMVRIHIAGVDPRIYKLADKIGLLLWVEVPSPHSSSRKSRENHFAELQRMLALIETHPAVIIWSLYNEDWGAQDIATNAETRRYIIDTYHHMHIHHPQFLVVDNDGWQHISYQGRLKSDLLTAHLYTPEIKRWKEVLDKMMNGDMDTVAFLPLVVGDPFFFRKQVPIIVSEWGGFGFIEYGGPKDNDERAVTIRAYKKELRKRSIAGDVYTQATNIEEERNGLIDASTGELRVPAGLLASKPPAKRRK